MKDLSGSDFCVTLAPASRTNVVDLPSGSAIKLVPTVLVQTAPHWQRHVWTKIFSSARQKINQISPRAHIDIRSDEAGGKARRPVLADATTRAGDIPPSSRSALAALPPPSNLPKEPNPRDQKVMPRVNAGSAPVSSVARRAAHLSKRSSLDRYRRARRPARHCRWRRRFRTNWPSSRA